jgi:hypothetical protein
MAELNQNQGPTETVAGDVSTAGPAAPQPGATPPPQDGKQAFVPFFNEEYEFKLGALGDVDTAYRLGAIFVLMLLAAAMMYIGAWWWVGTHPLAQNG